MTKKIFLTLFLLLSFSTSILAAGIYDSDKYAWGDNIGWVNFKLDNGNVDVLDDKITGYAWNDNYGWINLAPDNGGVLNDGSGNLSGYAWGENLGWINFDDVSIDDDGFFKGLAHTDNNGDITFEGDNVSVRTYWSTFRNLKLNNKDRILEIDEGLLKPEKIAIFTVEGGTSPYTYVLVDGNGSEDNSKFKIDGEYLILNFDPDYERPTDVGDGEKNNTYSIRIKVKDSNGLSFEKNFIIKVKNKDEVDIDRCQEHMLRGFAWSDGVGWISFDCKSAGSKVDYGVDFDEDGNLTGYIWSDSVGWIAFDYYNSNEDRPRYNIATKKLEGYVKALAGNNNINDGWIGKIALSGVSADSSTYAPEYTPSTKEFDKYAWGGSVSGWVDFKTEDNDGNILGVVTMDPFYFKLVSDKGMTVDDPVQSGGSVVLKWKTIGVQSCTASGGDGTSWADNPNKSIGEPNQATETISNLSVDTVFTLKCTDLLGNSIEKNITVKVAPELPSIDKFYAEDTNIPSGGSTTIHWDIKNVKNCRFRSSTGIDQMVDSSDGEYSISTGNLTESTNWFRLTCDSINSDYYPNGVDQLIYIDVEKLELEFYPEVNPLKFSDKIKLYWSPIFATKCIASGDLTNFNGHRDYSEGLRSWISSNKETEEGKKYEINMECTGTIGQKLKKTIYLRVGKNPNYQEI